MVIEGIWSEMVTVIGNGHSNPSSNLDEAVCISYGANTPGKGMSPTILLPTMSKQ